MHFTLDLLMIGSPDDTHSIQSFGILLFQFPWYQEFSKVIDPLGPRLFAQVLQSVLQQLYVTADPQCQPLLLNAWYLDDGALAGPGAAVLRA